MRPTREDADGRQHTIHPGTCPRCGCPIHHADDDHEIVWESGGRRASDCAHRRCVCHTDPILGDRHDVHTHEWDVHATAGGWVNRFKALGGVLGDVDPG